MRPSLITLCTALFISVTSIISAATKHRHVITFQSPNLNPESFTYDPNSHRFIIGGQKLLSVSAASDGATETLISDTSLPSNSSFLSLAVDRLNYRLLACIHAAAYNALASYDLRTSRRIFLTPLLPDQNPIAFVTEKIRPAAASDVAVDSLGNAYVTCSDGDIIWKVNINGNRSILSKSENFGFNGVVFIPNGEYLLTVQLNTGKMFKVNVDNGQTVTVTLNKDLKGAEKLAVRNNGVVVVASKLEVYYVKKEDTNWDKGIVFDEIALDLEGGATDVTVGNDHRVYVLYRHLMEGIIGNGIKDEFRIVEIEENKEDDDNAWLFVLVGFGLAYFLFWRFQMRRLVQNMDKRIA